MQVPANLVALSLSLVIIKGGGGVQVVEHISARQHPGVLKAPGFQLLSKYGAFNCFQAVGFKLAQPAAPRPCDEEKLREEEAALGRQTAAVRR